MTPIDDMYAAIEAILMVADEPVQAHDCVRALVSAGYLDVHIDEESSAERSDDTSDDVHEEQSPQADTTMSAQHVSQVEEIFKELAEQYRQQGRGFELNHTSRGWQLMSAQSYEQVVSSFVIDGQTARLSQAAVEALAIIAYKQPITRAQVTAIRGVNSDGVIRALSVRGLIREQGVDVQSRAALLVTSGLFLDKMGMESLAELPSLAPFLPEDSHFNDDGDDSVDGQMELV